MQDQIRATCFAVLAFLTALSLLPGAARGGTGLEPQLPDDISGLIETLASPNKPPRLRGDDDPVYPLGFERAAQERVFAAKQKLAEKGVAAFPKIIKHLRDARYSDTVAYAEYVNLTVGRVCEQIIAQQVLPKNVWRYKTRRGKDGQWHRPPNYLEAEGGVEKWWSVRSTKSLREMRIEALQWTIEQEQKIGFPAPNDQKMFLEPLQSDLRELQSQQDKKLSNTE